MGSLTAAHSNIEGIIHQICQDKWEKEVIKKKKNPHAVGWVFSQAQDCYFVKPDPNKVNTQYDQDEDCEPVSQFTPLI